MKICHHNLFLLLLGWLVILSFTPQAGAAQQSNRYRDARTGVEIACDVDKTMFPADWYPPPVSVKVAPLDVSNVEKALSILLPGLAKYPVGLLHKNLKRIYVVQQLSYYNTDIGGVGNEETKWIYLRYQGDRTEYSEAYLDAYFERELHHEFAHVLFANHADKFSHKQWLALNPPGFHYGKGGMTAIKKGQFLRSDASVYWKQGFANDYAVADYDEDVASLCELLFCGDQHFWQAVDQNPILHKKVAMLLAFYHALDSSLTPDYFRQLGSASHAQTSEMLAPPIPLATYSSGDLVVFPEGGWMDMPGTPARLIRVYAGEGGLYPSGGGFVVNIHFAKPSGVSSTMPLQPAPIPPPVLPVGYSSFWTQEMGWLIYPNTRGLQLKAGNLHLHYQPGDSLFFPYGGFIYLPGKGEPIRVAVGHAETYPAGAIVLFNAPLKAEGSTGKASSNPVP